MIARSALRKNGCTWISSYFERYLETLIIKAPSQLGYASTVGRDNAAISRILRTRRQHAATKDTTKTLPSVVGLHVDNREIEGLLHIHLEAPPPLPIPPEPFMARVTMTASAPFSSTIILARERQFGFTGLGLGFVRAHNKYKQWPI